MKSTHNWYKWINFLDIFEFCLQMWLHSLFPTISGCSGCSVALLGQPGCFWLEYREKQLNASGQRRDSSHGAGQNKHAVGCCQETGLALCWPHTRHSSRGPRYAGHVTDRLDRSRKAASVMRPVHRRAPLRRLVKKREAGGLWGFCCVVFIIRTCEANMNWHVGPDGESATEFRTQRSPPAANSCPAIRRWTTAATVRFPPFKLPFNLHDDQN